MCTTDTSIYENHDPLLLLQIHNLEYHATHVDAIHAIYNEATEALGDAEKKFMDNGIHHLRISK